MTPLNATGGPQRSSSGPCSGPEGRPSPSRFGNFGTKIPRAGALSTLPSTWQSLVNENDPADATNLALTDTSVPLVIAGGSKDTVVDPATTADLATEMCALSTPQNLERWVYTGLTHNNIDGPASINDYLAWTADRFAGSGTYTPKGTKANPATVTNSCG